MHLNPVVCLLLVTLQFGCLLERPVSAQTNQPQPSAAGEAKVSVFFGGTTVMAIEEVKTNALSALKSKGYAVPRAAHCVVNIQVLGEEPGCAVTFFDMEGKQEPPLSPGRAVWLARRAFAGEFADASSWRIDSLSIVNYPETVQNPASPIRDKRYYQVEFAPPEYKGPGEDKYPMWVLMDGTVVLPHPRKRSSL